MSPEGLHEPEELLKVLVARMSRIMPKLNITIKWIIKEEDVQH